MRDHLGRFVDCGNLKGRPRKIKKTLDQVRYRDEVFEATEELVTANINGKVEKTTAMNLIYKQLVRKALAGSERCMFKVVEMRHTFAAEELNERLKTFDSYLEALQDYRENPEDVPNHTIKTLAALREVFRDWLP